MEERTFPFLCVILAVMLDLVNVTKSFNDGAEELRVLAGVNFSLRAGETVALLGNSGSGKSTVLQIAAGLDPPDQGEVFFVDRSLYQMSEPELARLRRRDLGFVFQQFNLIPGLNVEANLLFQRRLNHLPDKDPWIEQLVDGLELRTLLARPVEVLSGGQQQRVAIGRALAHRPRLLFADEPTGNLQDGLGQRIVQILCDFTKESQASLLLVTHDQALACYADRQLHLQAGKLTDKSGESHRKNRPHP
ncbi:MAG: ABC transporter ATP-binding protein [Pseudomonadota bacterium]